MSRAQMTGLAVVVGIAIFLGVAVNIALVVFSVMSTRDMVRLDSQVRELTSVVAVLNQSLREASSSSQLRLETLNLTLDSTERHLETLNLSLEEKTSSTESCLENFRRTLDSTVTTTEQKLGLLNDSLTRSLNQLALKVSSNHTAVIQQLADTSRLTESILPKSCQQYRESGRADSGVYTLNLQDGGGPFKVYCDMKTEGHSWVVFQRRIDGSEDFNRTWAAYKAGFGRLEAEFWLGNEKLHRLTSAGLTRLRVDLRDRQYKTAYALYSSFSVAGEEDNYRLSLSGYSGTANDAFSYLSGQMFTSRDRDNDPRSIGNCADVHASGWWFQNCTAANLNGPYNATTAYLRIFWYSWYGNYDLLTWTEMKLLG